MQTKVYSNSDDTFLVWKTDAPIPECRGFAIYKKRDGAGAQPVTNYVGWGEKDEDGPRPSTEWPIQRYMWTDYKARSGEHVSYRIVPIIRNGAGELVSDETKASGCTDEITLRPDGTGGFPGYFNPRICPTQWRPPVLWPGRRGEGNQKLEELI